MRDIIIGPGTDGSDDDPWPFTEHETVPIVPPVPARLFGWGTLVCVWVVALAVMGVVGGAIGWWLATSGHVG